jgi:hypothetical protein
MVANPHPYGTPTEPCLDRRYEKRPAQPLPDTPRPGSRDDPHRVRDGETLESVARDGGVLIDHLLWHNFGTKDPREINWYLHHYVGCRLPTHDRKNWRFSSAAKPGLIYLPQKVLHNEPPAPGATALPGPANLNVSWPLEFLASMKFVEEFKVGPKEMGFFKVQLKVSVEGELKQQGGVLKVAVKKSGVKAALEKQFDADTKGVFALNLDKKTLVPIADAFKKGSKTEIAKAIAKPFTAELTTSATYHCGDHAWVKPEAGVELSDMPVLVRLSGEWERRMEVEGVPFKGKFIVKGQLNIGLSKQSWEWLAENVGRPLLERFLATEGGAALAEVAATLGATGVAIVGLGTLVGVVGVSSLLAWVIEDGNRKALLKTLPLWYYAGYTAKVFGELRPAGGTADDDARLVLLGEQDALKDARSALAKVKHPAAQGTDRQQLEAYASLLVAECTGNNYTQKVYNAKIKLRQALEQKAQAAAGL